MVVTAEAQQPAGIDRRDCELRSTLGKRSGDAHRVTLEHLGAQAIQRFTSFEVVFDVTL
jgi:hypothetical protein